MALGSPNSLGQLTAVRNHLAYELGVAAFTDLPSTQQSLYNDFLEMALDEIASRAEWVWLLREGYFTTKAPYTTGTVAVTNGSTTVTGTGTAFTTGTNAAVDEVIRVGTDSSYYRIASVDTATQLTLRSAYAGDTASGASYRISADEYNLARGVDWLKLIYEQATPYVLDGVAFDALMHQAKVVYWHEGAPRLWAISEANYGATTDRPVRIRLWPIPDDDYAMVYRYKSYATFPASGTAEFETEPALQNLLIAGVMALVWKSRGEFDRARFAMEDFERLMALALQKLNKTASARVVLARQWWPTGSRNWDRLPYVPTTIPTS